MEKVMIPEAVSVVLEVRRLPGGRRQGVQARAALAIEGPDAAREHLAAVRRAYPERCYIRCVVHPREGINFGPEDVAHVNAALGTTMPPGHMVIDHVSSWHIWAAAVDLVGHCCEDVVPLPDQLGDISKGDVPNVH